MRSSVDCKEHDTAHGYTAPRMGPWGVGHTPDGDRRPKMEWTGTCSDVRAARKSMKNGKAAGACEIFSELQKENEMIWNMWLTEGSTRSGRQRMC